MAVKIDGEGGAAWTCHNCHWAGNVPSERLDDFGLPPLRKPVVRPAPVENPDKPASMYDWFSKRGISGETVDRFGCFVTEQWFPQANAEKRCIAIPYIRRGELVNHKYRTAEKEFRQDKDAERSLFNLDALEGQDTAIFVEGEMDVLALAEAGITNAVSLPDGAPAKLKDEPDPEDKRFVALANCEAELAHVEKFVIAVDADEPGNVLAEELARRLGRERCWRVQWPTLNDAPRKDANEVLVEDGAEVLRECIEAAEPYPVSGLYGAADYGDKIFELFRNGYGAGLSTGWPEVDEFITVREGDFTVVTGIPNHGKSEFIDALLVNMARLHGWKFALCSFENQPEEHVAKLAEKWAHAPFWDGPTPRMDEATLRTAVDWINERFTFIRAEDESPTIEWILEKAKAAVLRMGIKGLVIDPWNEIEHNRPDRMSETEYVSQVLGKVRRFAKVSGVHVWFVAHPMKLLRDKDGKRPAPGPYDISGSAHWANKADFAITVHRPDDHGTITEIHIAKVRHKWLGKKGLVKLRYQPATGEYTDNLEAYER